METHPCPPVRSFVWPADRVRVSPFMTSSKLTEGRKDRPSPVENKMLEDRYTEKGYLFPPDTSNASDPLFWGLPAHTYLNLDGMGLRQLHLLYYKVVVEDLLAQASMDSIFFIPLERSLKYCKIAVDVCPTVVSAAEWVVLDRGTSTPRFSWVTVDEFFRFQGMVLEEMMPGYEYARLTEFRNSELVKLAGAAFHCPSVGAFVFSALMLR